MPVSYIGGKSRISKWITPHYPSNITNYSECFGGMFWCFFNMDVEKFPNLTNIIYNDFNPLNYNLFKCIQNPTRLLEEINSIPCQQFGEEPTPPIYKEQFIRFQAEIFDENFSVEPGDFNAAAKYVYVLTQVFSGSKPETSNYVDYKGKYRCKVLIFLDKLKNPKYQEHFEKITFVENLDFEKVVEKYDSPTTYFYMDPPYWKTENYYSKHDFDVDDHKRLSNVLKPIQGKFGLSYYEFPQLNEWYPSNENFKWESKSFKKAAGSKKDGTQNEGIELLIMNY